MTLKAYKAYSSKASIDACFLVFAKNCKVAKHIGWKFVKGRPYFVKGYFDFTLRLIKTEDLERAWKYIDTGKASEGIPHFSDQVLRGFK